MVTSRASPVAVLALVVAACGGAVTPPYAPTSSPSAPFPSVGPPSTSPAGSATSDPAAAAASSYYSALSIYIGAVERAGPDCGTLTIDAQRRCFETSATALGRFKARVQSIDLPAGVSANAEALLAAISTLDDLLAGARDEGSLDRLTSHWWPRLDPADVGVLEAAGALRVALGLPPVSSD